MSDDVMPPEPPPYAYEGEITTVTQSPPTAPHNPFAATQSEHVSLGAVAIESQRVAAEVQGRMIVAKRFPRDSGMAYANAMQACQRLGLADCAIYAYSRAGSKIKGPSIRLAEELARHWGNIEYGLIELSRRPGESEMEAFAWDIETNTRSSQKFTVKHIRDRSEGKGGNAALTAERDIYEITANNGARRMRARILAILPPELVDDAVAACEETVKRGGGQPLGDRIRAMMGSFIGVGVTPQMIAEKVGHAIDQITPDELSELRGVLQAVKDGAKASEFFGAKITPTTLPANADAFEKAALGKTALPAQQGSGNEAAERQGAPDPQEDAASVLALLPKARKPRDLADMQADSSVKPILERLAAHPAIHKQVMEQIEARRLALLAGPTKSEAA